MPAIMAVTKNATGVSPRPKADRPGQGKNRQAPTDAEHGRTYQHGRRCGSLPHAEILGEDRLGKVPADPHTRHGHHHSARENEHQARVPVAACYIEKTRNAGWIDHARQRKAESEQRSRANARATRSKRDFS